MMYENFHFANLSRNLGDIDTVTLAVKNGVFQRKEIARNQRR